MTVGELKVLLKNVDDNRIVILAKDSGGNHFSPCHEISNHDAYLAETTWSGQVGLESLEGEDENYTEDDVVDGEPCITLWPTN